LGKKGSFSPGGGGNDPRGRSCAYLLRKKEEASASPEKGEGGLKKEGGQWPKTLRGICHFNFFEKKGKGAFAVLKMSGGDRCAMDYNGKEGKTGERAGKVAIWRMGASSPSMKEKAKKESFIPSVSSKGGGGEKGEKKGRRHSGGDKRRKVRE